MSFTFISTFVSGLMDRLRDSSLDFQVPVYFVEEFYDFVNNSFTAQEFVGAHLKTERSNIHFLSNGEAYEGARFKGLPHEDFTIGGRARLDDLEHSRHKLLVVVLELVLSSEQSGVETWAYIRSSSNKCKCTFSQNKNTIAISWLVAEQPL